MSELRGSFGASAYGGPGWSGRTRPHSAEIGDIWADCGVGDEWSPLRAVLLHRPGPELVSADDPDAVQMLAPIDLGKAQAEHDAIAQAYRDHGVEVHLVAPSGPPPPNQMFVADLLFMTPEGAVLARPASTVRAGEERRVARRLAALGIPILRSLRGTATFEGADAAWLDPGTVLIGRGLRTNAEGIAQVGALLEEMGVAVIVVDLPFGTMHLMGTLRFADRDLAVGFPRRVPFAAVEALRARGFEVVFLPDEAEAEHGSALNFVTLGPRKILMVEGNPATRTFLEAHGVESVSVPAGELRKAAGAVGCLTGVLWRGDG
ncbi:MAG: amidinotransferase [Proteobacteria bacterium]|nr:amidinotransferase [Pseudomonadota bacterium]